MTTRRRCFWRGALQHFYLDCKYCGAHVVPDAVEARPCWTDSHWRTKARWAIYRHLKVEHPGKFEAHFGNGAA